MSCGQEHHRSNIYLIKLRNQLEKLKKMEGVVCKYFQTGYCKFQEHCRKHQVKEICETENCKTKSCKYRHPKVCKIFTAHNACKYGKHCAYQHKTTKAGNEIIEIMINMNALENTVTLLSEKIIKNPNTSQHCDLTFRKDN